jgi:hypothetical protein
MNELAYGIAGIVLAAIFAIVTNKLHSYDHDVHLC